MKIFAGVVIFTCLAFPAFSQQRANMQRYNALSDTIASTVTSSNATLADFDDMLQEDGAVKNYTAFKRSYDSLAKALLDSENRLNFLIRTNDRSLYIKEERDNYESLIRELEAVKSEYDSWLNTVR